MDESAKGIYDIILGRYQLTVLWLNIKFSDQVMESDDGPLKVYTAPMVDLCTYNLKI